MAEERFWHANRLSRATRVEKGVVMQIEVKEGAAMQIKVNEAN